MRRTPVVEVALLFAKLGLIAFGGPAAHTAMMRDEVVRRRGWLTDERFVDLMSATNLIPGPNSTELAIHIGYDRARWRGLVVAGVCFILPAATLVTGLAWAYVHYGRTPAVQGLLYGITPVVIAIVAYALFGLLRSVVKTAWAGVLAVAGLVAYLVGVNELLILVAGGVVAALVYLIRNPPRTPPRSASLVLAFLGDDANRLWQLFTTMLKIGAVLYGSGYVLFAFLGGDFVDRLGWITEQQLTDAVAVGQLTPGPVFTAATFVGYLVAGVPGAIVATVAIFLPSFLLVGLLTRITDGLRSSPWTSAVLDGLNATALALMAGVSYQLARTAIVDLLTAALALVTLLLLWRTRFNNAWYVLAGAVIGLGHGWLS